MARITLIILLPSILYAFESINISSTIGNRRLMSIYTERVHILYGEKIRRVSLYNKGIIKTIKIGHINHFFSPLLKRGYEGALICTNKEDTDVFLLFGKKKEGFCIKRPEHSFFLFFDDGTYYTGWGCVANIWNAKTKFSQVFGKKEGFFLQMHKKVKNYHVLYQIKKCKKRSQRFIIQRRFGKKNIAFFYDERTGPSINCRIPIYISLLSIKYGKSMSFLLSIPSSVCRWNLFFDEGRRYYISFARKGIFFKIEQRLKKGTEKTYTISLNKRGIFALLRYKEDEAFFLIRKRFL